MELLTYFNFEITELWLNFNSRMVTQSKGSATGSIFLSSPPNSAFGKTLRNNMDSNSFLRGNYTETILSNSKTAIFATTNSMRNREDYKECRVCNIVRKAI